jgi:hypothetical protein
MDWISWTRALDPEETMPASQLGFSRLKDADFERIRSSFNTFARLP